jgi:hypothetical protein
LRNTSRRAEAGIGIPRTHELTLLLNLCTPLEPLWTVFNRPFAAMSQFAVLLRYPGKKGHRRRGARRNRHVPPLPLDRAADAWAQAVGTM